MSSEALFDLIKSLNKSEKGYFKKYAKKHVIGEENNYITLFDAIDKQTEYDEKAIVEKFKSKRYVKYLSSEKSYLSKIILDSLVSYHNNSFIAMSIERMLGQIEILHEKGLYDFCEKIIDKAKKTAQEHQQFGFWRELIQWQKRIISARGYQAYPENIVDTICNEEKKVGEFILNENEFGRLQGKLFRFVHMHGYPRLKKDKTIFEQILKNPLLDEETNAITFLGRLYFYNIHLAKNVILFHDYEQALLYSQKQIAWMEKHVVILPHQILRYMSSLGNAVTYQMYLYKAEDFEMTIQKIKNIPKHFKKEKDQRLQALIFLRTFPHEVSFYIKTAQFEKGIELIAPIKEMVSKLHFENNQYYLMPLYYSIAQLLFIKGKYEDAIEWLNKIDLVSTDARQDVQCYAKILSLITHFELKNELLIPSLLKSTYRFLLKKQKLCKSEEVIIKYLKKASRINSTKKVLDLFHYLKADLVKVFENEEERKNLAYFDFVSWCESKLDKRSLPDILKEKLER